jgi:hypothetical protein
MDDVVAAAGGFLLAVLWFDLMFDVQVLSHRTEREAPEDVLASIAAYYRRVTTTASPMGRLVAVAMIALLAGLITEAIRGDEARWLTVASFALAAPAIGLAMLRTFGAARRLVLRVDAPERQAALARGILRDHLVCLGLMGSFLALRLAAA